MGVILFALIAKALLFLVEILPKTFVSAEAYGYYSYNVTQIALFSSLVSFGGVNYLLKDLPLSKNEFSSFFVTTVISFLLSLILFLILRVSSVVIISSFCLSLIGITSVYYRFKGHTITWYILKDIVKSVLFVVVILFFYTEKISGEQLTNSYMYSMLGTSLIISFCIIKNYSTSLSFSLSISDIKKRIINSAPIVFTGLTYLLVSRVDTFYVKEYFGYEVLSDYNFVSRVMYQSLFFMQIFQAKGLHKISISFSKNNHKEALKEANNIRWKSFIYTLSLSFCIAFFINVDLVGEYFNLKSGFILPLTAVFLLLHVVSAALGLYGYMLLYIDRQIYSLFNSFIVLAVSFVFIPVFMKFFGIVGVAMGVMVSIILGNILEKLQFEYFIKKSYLAKMK